MNLPEAPSEIVLILLLQIHAYDIKVNLASLIFPGNYTLEITKKNHKAAMIIFWNTLCTIKLVPVANLYYLLGRPTRFAKAQ